jgi:hypothetical protein
MVYTLIGKAVVKGLKIFLRRRYGPTYAPKPLLAGAVVVAVVGAALVAAKREQS